MKLVSLTNPYVESLLAAGVFAVVLEVLFIRPSFFIWGGATLFVASYYYLLYKNLRVLILPVLLLLGVWGGIEFYLSFRSPLRELVTGIFTLIFFFVHFNFRVFHRSDFFRKDLFYLLNVVVLLSFLNSLFILADFDAVSYFVLLLLSLSGGGLIGLNLFYLYKKERVILALIFAFITLELFWLVSFWPFFYLTSAGVLVILYYSLWRIAIESLEGKLSAPFFLRVFLFAAVLTGLLLFLTPWLSL